MEQKLDLKPKFDVSILMSVGITIVVVAIMLAFGLQITGDVRDDIAVDSCAGKTTYTSYNEATGLCYNPANASQTQAVGTSEYNATVDGLEAVSKISGKLGIIVTVIIAGVLLGILIRYLYVKM